jgi:hypothetical protein
MSVEERIERLEEQHQRIEEKLDKILEFLECKVNKSCEKMSEHIDFIDAVYDNVKKPLGYVCNRVSNLMAPSDNFAITDKKEDDLLALEN